MDLNTNLTPQLEDAVRLIDRWLAYRVYANRLPGLSIGIIHQDKVLLSKGYGYADLERKQEASDITCYRIASFSKIFTAIAIMQLFERGKLHLDERVQHYLPWCVAEQQAEIKHITIRQLLSHTSGLDRDGDTSHWDDYRFPDLARIQQHFKRGALIYSPTEQWKYSNYGYTLLGEIVKAVSGMTYEEYVIENIVKPLGLTHTAPILSENITARLALGYSRDLPEQARQPFPLIETNIMASATGFSSNVVDFCQFMMAQLDGDTRLLKDETRREMRLIQWLREGGESDWCLGYETWKINGQRIYGHGGSFQGYRSRFGIDTERGIGVVVFANAMDAPSATLANGVLHVIDDVITHYAEYDKLAQAQPLEQAQRYEGYFRSIWGDTATASINGGLVFYTPGADIPPNDFHRLEHEQGEQFIIKSGDTFGNIGERARFEFDDEGQVRKLWIGPDYNERLDMH